MHEYSLVMALLEQVKEQLRLHRAERATRVWVEVGELSGVEPALLQSAYDAFRQATPCAEAPLILTVIAARWHCRCCGQLFGKGAVLRCSQCAVPASLLTGGELILKRVEMHRCEGAIHV